MRVKRCFFPSYLLSLCDLHTSRSISTQYIIAIIELIESRRHGKRISFETIAFR